MYSFHITGSIKEIGKEEWDALAEDNVFSSYGWLETFEETFNEDLKPQFILIKKSSTLVGATVCYIVGKNNTFVKLDSFMFGRLKKLINSVRISFYPALICCFPKSYGSHFLVNKNLKKDERKKIVSDLSKIIEELSIKHKLSVTFFNVLENERELIHLLSEKGYIKTLGFPLNFLQIRWSHFDGYNRYLKRNKLNKKGINREINKNKKEGVIIKELNDLDETEGRLFDLVNQNYEKYNGIKFPFKKNLISQLKQNLKNEVKIYASIKNNKYTGVSLVLKRRNFGYVFITGVDHQTSGNDFTYFNLCYYRPIADAISEKTQGLYFGNSMYNLKTRRGCKLIDSYAFYKPTNITMKALIILWFKIHSLWYRSKIPKKVKKRVGYD